MVSTHANIGSFIKLDTVSAFSWEQSGLDRTWGARWFSATSVLAASVRARDPGAIADEANIRHGDFRPSGAGLLYAESGSHDERLCDWRIAVAPNSAWEHPNRSA